MTKDKKDSCIPCNTCKYYEDSIYCRHPKTYTKINYITCEKSQEYSICSIWRGKPFAHINPTCGAEAKWFKPKSFKLIKNKSWWDW